MKKCSICGREFSEQNLQFCPDDGNALIENNQNVDGDLPPTIFSIGANQVNTPFTPPSGASSFSPQTSFGNPQGGYANQTPPNNTQRGFNQQPSPQNPFGNSGAAGAGSGLGSGSAFNSPYDRPASTQKSKLPLILGGLALLFILGGGAILAIGAFVWFGSSKGDDKAEINASTKEGQIKARLLDLFSNCQKQNHSAAAEFFYYRGQPIKQEDVERECRPIKGSLDSGSGYEFGNFLTQGAGEKEVNAWEVYFKRGAEKIGQIFAFQMIDGKYRLVDIDPIQEKAPVVSNANTYTPSNTNSYTPSNTNQAPNSGGRTFDSLRQYQLGSFKLLKTEKTNYMKSYPNLEEESLTYVNSGGKKVFVNKTRFPSKAEALDVVRNMIQSAKNGGAQFTETVPCYSNDGREVGLTATRTGDKDGKKNYTIYYSHDNVVTFIFSLENDKAAVDEVFKYGEY